MRLPRAVTSVEICKALVKAGFITEAMLNDIINAKILLQPGDMAVLELSIILDERIYDIVSPRARDTVKVDGNGSGAIVEEAESG